MAPQSHAPAILLTRPLTQSRRFARQLRRAARGPLFITIAPLMQVAFHQPLIPHRAPKGLIFTSEAGVAAYQRLPDRPIAPVYCVGGQTAKAAQSALLEPVLVAKDAASLIAAIQQQRPPTPLLHLRGTYSHGEVAERLSAAGFQTQEAIVYTQHAIPLPARVHRLIASGRPIILPLFSVRSAQLFAEANPPPGSITIVALSDAVAAAIPPDLSARILVSLEPTGPAMLATVLGRLKEPASA